MTILAFGPLTNIALATREHPGIVPSIKQIICMGGALDVPGNTTASAEFNWWFDPEAAKTVLRLPIRHTVIPLDVTDTVKMDKALYDHVAHDPLVVQLPVHLPRGRGRTARTRVGPCVAVCRVTGVPALAARPMTCRQRSSAMATSR